MRRPKTRRGDQNEITESKPDLFRGSGDTNDFLLLNAGGYERLRVATNGNVGIGTTAPDEQFSLTGNQHFTSTGSSIYVKPSSAATTNLDLFSLASGTASYGANGAG